jgi:hypothetical protein
MDNLKKLNIEHSKVEQLIPQQLLGDAQQLVEFLKEYYNFLNADGNPSDIINNMLQNKDLDLLVDSFIDLVRKEIGEGLSRNLVANKINVYKNIIQLYQAKGSIASFKLLFRILFNTEIDIGLPKEQIFVASDGRWVQQNSLFVDVISGDPFNTVGNIVLITTPTGTKIKVDVERVKRISPTLFEIIISKEYIGNITSGSTVTFNSFSGNIKNALNKFKIISSGRNFKTGQFITINDHDGTNTRIKVTSVDANGGILNIDFINFGTNYPDTYNIQMIPKGYDYKTYPDPSNPLLASITDIYETCHTHDNGYIQLNSDTPIAFGSEYNPSENDENDINLEISLDPLDDVILYPSRAIIKFTSNPVSKYKGAYTSNKGFLSDGIYVQDGYYYQPYSYVIKSDIDFSIYENLAKQSVHPAGMIMFGEININNIIDASTYIKVLLNYFNVRFYDSVDTSDIMAVLYIKPLLDDVYTIDSVSKEQGKNIHEIYNINTIEDGVIDINPYAVDYFDEEYTDSRVGTF